jgi:purine-binding chemotaxis protein CheW
MWRIARSRVLNITRLWAVYKWIPRPPRKSCRIASFSFAFRVALSALAGMPDFVLGVALVRGTPTPVIDLAAALFGVTQHAGTRFVILRVGGRAVAVLVTAVLGMAKLDSAWIQALPPVLQSARADFIEAIGRADSELLVTLRSGRLVPEAVWSAVASAAGR